ncbi:hypothetical protein E1B28_006090 [Marasmius oreades]|uniref:Uncharacterized protein n=1 Tax=Marasmius oreades TaxID=181124 RepID=A0A9P7S4V9_9AGAR|nr:uncharacterized protein E1B28_006090 [Marasmius oreades]KAG7095325.1 hypothetical protein E1B28_006090 [Marasmius oreades]
MMPIDGRLVDNYVARTRPDLHNMLNTLGQHIRSELTLENARLEERVSTLQGQLVSVDTQLSGTKLKLDEANSKIADMDGKLVDAHTKVDEMENELQELRRSNAEMKRELEQAKKRWRGIVLPGYHEMELEREKLRRKLEKKEDEVVFYKLKTKAARKLVKKAAYVLKEDDVVVYRRPGSRSSVSSESSCYLQYARRRI